MFEYIFEILSEQLYSYLCLSSIGNLYNTSRIFKNYIKLSIKVDKRILCPYCPCNICDTIYSEFIQMYPLMINKYIILACPWYYNIFKKRIYNCHLKYD